MEIPVHNMYQLEPNNKTLETMKKSAGRAAAGASIKGIDKSSKLYKVCKEFEAIFIKQMLNVMRKTVNKSKLFHGGFTEEVFEDMLYDNYAKKMAENANFGLSEMMYKQLSH